MLKENLVVWFEKAIRENWYSPALSDYGASTYSYGQVAEQILRLHALFERFGVSRGDKIALTGKNLANWCLVYLATVSYGAVIVPILAEFLPDDMQHIVNHSDAVLLFASEAIAEKLDELQMKRLDAIFSLEELSLLYARRNAYLSYPDRVSRSFGDTYGKLLSPDNFRLPKVPNKELAAIVYTSGTTGFSKGVMLAHNSLIANVRFGCEHIPLEPGSRFVSLLPLAHTYGCAFEFLFPFCKGVDITLLGRTPSPKAAMQAFAEVRPNLIISVPLVIEKIYRTRIRHMIDKTAIKVLRRVPGVSGLISNKILKGLNDAFGGNFYEVVIGGAPINGEVAEFLTKIGFRYTVGYGMTECGPLISYTDYKNFKIHSAGTAIDTITVRIDSPDPQNIVGEILVRGENVMNGYYKNPQATREVLDKNGWLHTGDMGVVDKDGFIYIRGRSKVMLLTSSGENVYPEEIEARLNNMPLVDESLVIERNGQFVALVYADASAGLSEDEVMEQMEKNRKELNEHIPRSWSIARIQLFPEEFEKTPTKKIKRYLYSN